MKYYFSKTLLLSLFVILGLTACEGDNSKIKLKPQEKTKVRIPKFDGQAAKVFVDKQVAFGPRVPNSEGHKKCKEWLVSTFQSFGAKVQEQDFTATSFNNIELNGTNIIARYNPEVKERVILAAHWDTRPFADKDPDQLKQSDPILGADDGGSGVGVLLEIAKNLQAHPIPMGVDLILFDAEDYGDDKGEDVNSWGLGSQHWAKNPHLSVQDVKYGILLDMVGAKGAKFYQEGFSLQNAGPLVRKIWDLARLMKKDQLFINQKSPPVIDDHFFVMKYFGMPMVDIINRPSDEFGFGKHWHTHGDNMEVIDANVLGAVGQVVTAVIYKESNMEF